MTDPKNNLNSTLSNKRNKVIEAIYRFDADGLKALAAEEILINEPIQDVRVLCALSLFIQEWTFFTSSCQ